ncbi:SLC13 family permease [Lactococcus nasutitermitis]|uniref:SLC13 family permease n=1 Tax=Lactococcus nasutitermitis TaxID=1652957 RepID=A0ABV9JDD2_9LACT|nr:SLC13 family permease [Lactococcus nasutitermitis]
MEQPLPEQPKQGMLGTIWNWFKEDKVFLVSFILAVIFIIFGNAHFTTKFFDYKVIVTVFALMLVVAGFRDTGLLRHFGQTLVNRSKNTRQLVRFTTMLSFISSIFFTNDVAILTMLPLYLILTKNIKNRRSVYLGASFILPAVHLGSGLLPSGNPHNLYLYSFFKIPTFDFLKGTGLMFIAGFIMLNLACFFIAKDPIEIDTHVNHFRHRHTFVYVILMILMIAAVLHGDKILLYIAAAIVAVTVFFYQRKLFKQVDYHLLLTFVCFFIIVGNISTITVLTNFLRPFFQSVSGSFLGTIIVSQGISNIPASVLIAPFTTHGLAVVLGADVGGIGTIMASMATLIFYKVMTLQAFAERKGFVRYFMITNTIFVIALAVIGLLVLHFIS